MAANEFFMDLAIEIATNNVSSGAGGPFGAVVVRSGDIVASAANMVMETNDPTAHAEIVAIRRACEKLGRFQLNDCDIYTSCEPCPMCLGAMYWARPAAVYYANTREDAAAAGFDDAFIYVEAARPPQERQLRMVHLLFTKARESFDVWHQSQIQIKY